MNRNITTFRYAPLGSKLSTKLFNNLNSLEYLVCNAFRHYICVYFAAVTAKNWQLQKNKRILIP